MADDQILIIYTGGTIGMLKNEHDVLAPSSYDNLANAIPQIAHFNTSYTSFSPPLDSSQITSNNWQSIYDGIIESSCNKIVVLHGTDTMAYTASALALLLGETNKTVVLTGSQLPVNTEGSDAKNNMINALHVAREGKVKGVFVWFHQELYSALHVKKTHTTAFKGFSSPNQEVVATKNGQETTYNKTGFIGINHHLQLKCSNNNQNILHMQCAPAMNIDVYKSAVLNSQAILIEVFGSGTAPFDEKSQWFTALKKASENGCCIFIKPQCSQGELELGTYAAGQALKAINPIIGKSISSEATYVLLIIALSNKISPQVLVDLL